MTPEAGGGSYIHGTDPGEQRRLSLLNDVLNPASLRELALRGGERILDVGAGLGQFSRVMARAAGPAGHVVAIERSAEQLERAGALAREAGEEGLVEFRRGDAAALPLRDDEWGAFDVVHARFLLEHVTDPAAIVRSMARAAAPGGRIVLEDDDHDVLRLHPEPAGFAELWRAYMRAFERLGNDPFVGRRLVSLFYQAGAEPVRSTWIYFGACAGDPRFPRYVDNMVGVIAGALRGPEYAEPIERLRRWSRLPDAVLWYALCWAEGRIRAAE